MDVLQARADEVFDVVNSVPISVGDEFYNQTISEPPKRKVTEIIEQRPERGIYKDESDRRMWARIKSELVL